MEGKQKHCGVGLAGVYKPETLQTFVRHLVSFRKDMFAQWIGLVSSWIFIMAGEGNLVASRQRS